MDNITTLQQICAQPAKPLAKLAPVVQAQIVLHVLFLFITKPLLKHACLLATQGIILLHLPALFLLVLAATQAVRRVLVLLALTACRVVDNSFTTLQQRPVIVLVHQGSSRILPIMHAHHAIQLAPLALVEAAQIVSHARCLNTTRLKRINVFLLAIQINTHRLIHLSVSAAIQLVLHALVLPA